MTAHAAVFGAVVGALLARPVWLPVVALAAAVAVRQRGAVIVALAMGLAVSIAGHRALVGLDPPSPGSFDSWVTVVDDPQAVGSGVRATVRHDGRLLSATAHTFVAGRLDDVGAGERVRLRGTIRPVSSTDDWSRWNHVVGRITVDTVGVTAPAAPVAELANSIRGLLARGAEVLSEDDRALLLGMVVGDNRGQSAAIADDFRAAGLGHLLVVSGQNVAFVLALASPLALRLRPGPRMLALLAVLLLFSVITRFEPSVLRAVAMGGIGVAGPALGFPIDGRRALAWAVAALLLVDPFLIHVVAFRLSVAATAGIVWLAGPLAERCRGPRPVALAFATTAAAQLAVAPVLLLTFGPVPLAALPANLLAGPASGPVMMWGATAGLLAGVTGGPVASTVHLPTRALLWWVRSVASAAATAPPAMIGAVGLVALAAAVAGALVRSRPARVFAVAAVTAVTLGSVAAAGSPPSGLTPLGRGVDVWREGSTTVLILRDPALPRQVLETTRLAGVGRPDLVIAGDGDAADASAVVALVDRYGPLPILAPPLHRVPGARTARIGQVVRLGPATVEVVNVDPSLAVVLSPADGVRATVGGG